MPCPSCPGNSTTFSGRRGGLSQGLREMSRAAVAAGRARLREAGVLLQTVDPRARLSACAGCPLRTRVDGVAYCGRPLWQRDVLANRPEPGCGCPLADKARDPTAHCPIADDFAPIVAASCRCRWCVADSRLAAG